MIRASIIADIEQARRQLGLPFDPTLLKLFKDDASDDGAMFNAQISRQPLVQADTPTLLEAYRQYMSDPTRAWSKSTRSAYETVQKLTLSVIGESTPMGSLSRAHCREVLDILTHLPKNASKRFPKLSPKEAAELTKKNGSIEVISAANANSLLLNFSTFLNWAVNEEMLQRNPVRGLRLHDAVAKKDKRLPFSKEQLKAIFNAPLYRGCENGGRGYVNVGTERPRNARFWVPLIALHTGARLGEICQLDVTDIRLVEGVPCMVVSQQSAVGTTDKQLKTKVSERTIPLHQSLLDLGLVAFAADQKRVGEVKLFNDIAGSPSAPRSVAFSKWFTQFLRSCRATKDLTCFHSFRHNFRDELRIARVDHDLSMLLGGWTRGSSGQGASENYGAGFRIDALHDAISSLKFSDVDIRHLKV